MALEGIAGLFKKKTLIFIMKNLLFRAFMRNISTLTQHLFKSFIVILEKALPSRHDVYFSYYQDLIKSQIY